MSDCVLGSGYHVYSGDWHTANQCQFEVNDTHLLETGAPSGDYWTRKALVLKTLGRCFYISFSLYLFILVPLQKKQLWSISCRISSWNQPILINEDTNASAMIWKSYVF